MAPRELRVDVGGRTVAALVVGADDGPLVVYHHGSPSSRLEVTWHDEVSRRRGVRVVGIDRPGYGASDPETFTFASVAADACMVADALGAGRFAVVGQSSGCGHAFATAVHAPDRVSAVAVGGGSVPYLPGTGRWELLHDEDRAGLALVGVDDAEAERLLAVHDEEFLRVALAMGDDELAASWSDWLEPDDRRVLAAGLDRQLVAGTRECARQGMAGWGRDNVVRMPAWPFRLRALRCPAVAWYGAGETVAAESAAWLREQEDRIEVRWVEGAAHLVMFERWDEVLDSLGL